MRPTQFLNDWSSRDRGLARALRMVHRGACPCGCGNPARLTLDGETNGYWDASSEVCEARAALQEAQKQAGDAVPGEMWTVSFLADDYARDHDEH